MFALPMLVAAQAAGSNLFASHDYYVNAVYQRRVHGLLSAPWVDAHSYSSLLAMETLGSALWVDSIAKVHGPEVGKLESTLRDAASKPVPPLVVAILYDLPNRDCHALASNGELCCQFAADGTCVYDAADQSCTEGLARYKSHYVDAFAALLERFGSVPVAVVVEPDSMANLATNLDDRRCGNGATQTAYVEGIRYALETLHRRAPHASLYLDAGHGGWLGWPDKADAFLGVVNRIGSAASHLRGFATNVANYQALGQACPASAFDVGWPQLHQPSQYCGKHPNAPCCADPCGLLPHFNSGNNELNFVQLLNSRLQRSPLKSRLPQPRFIIDTGRNGRADMRSDCANWCNARGAGVGHAPTSETPIPIVDAFYWLKTPGESDGCTQELPDGSACGRYDGMCGSIDSLGSRNGEPRSPEAGEWSVPHVAGLVCRARLDGEAYSPSDESRCAGTVTAAVAAERAAALSATLPPPPPPPRYNWKSDVVADDSPSLQEEDDLFLDVTAESEPQPAAMAAAVTAATAPASVAARPDAVGCECVDSSYSAGLLVGALGVFTLWFVYPRYMWSVHPAVEQRLRATLGGDRFDAIRAAVSRGAIHAGYAYDRLGATAGRLADSVMRAREAGGGRAAVPGSRLNPNAMRMAVLPADESVAMDEVDVRGGKGARSSASAAQTQRGV